MKSFIVAICSVLLTTCATQAATVAFYDFNGSGTATVGSTITDSVGGHNGTVTGGDLFYGFDLQVGSYLTFAADAGVGNPGNRVVVPGSADFVFTGTQAYTIETIFRTTQTVTNGVIFSKGADVSNPDSQWWLRHQGNGQLRIDLEGDTGGGVEDNATSPTATPYHDGQWHSVVCVFDGTLVSKRLDLYVDGVLKASDTSIGTSGVIGGTDSDPVIFGEFASLAANRSFAGDIAAIRFSNSALNPAEFLTVPEPSSAMLLLTGLLASPLLRRARK